MKKRLLIALILLLLLSTYNIQNNISFFSNLNIKKITIKNNNIIKEVQIKTQLSFLYEKNIFFLSVIDRYFERRSKILKIKSINEKNLRIIKSYFYSIAHFLKIQNSLKLKKIFNSNLKNYWIIRKLSKSGQSKEFINKIRKDDIEVFYPLINKYCETKYPLNDFNGNLKIKNAMKF